MDPNFWALVIAQLPALAGGFTALQRGWLHLGSTIDRERLVWIERFTELRKSFEREQASLNEALAREVAARAEANADRRSAEQRLQLFMDSMRATVDVLERSVALSEKLSEKVLREPNSRTRASD